MLNCGKHPACLIIPWLSQQASEVNSIWVLTLTIEIRRTEWVKIPSLNEMNTAGKLRN